jgi:hypothetical protein
VVTLDVLASVDYDLYLYKGNCTTQIGSSVNGTGQKESIDYQESCNADDSDYYYVRVHRFAQFSCSQSYTLTVNAHL